MNIKLNKDNELKSLNQVTIKGIKFGVSDKEIKSFIMDLIDVRPDILQEEEILSKLIQLFPEEEFNLS